MPPQVGYLTADWTRTSPACVRSPPLHLAAAASAAARNCRRSRRLPCCQHLRSTPRKAEDRPLIGSTVQKRAVML